MAAELKPCPFCGGEAYTLPPTLHRHQQHTDPATTPGRFYSIVRCRDCGAQINGPDFDTSCEAAVAVWNRHSAPPAVPEGMGSLTERLQSMRDAAYCESLSIARSTPCLGWEAKVRSGEFGRTEMEAHQASNLAMGRYQGLSRALEVIAEIAAAQPEEGK